VDLAVGVLDMRRGSSLPRILYIIHPRTIPLLHQAVQIHFLPPLHHPPPPHVTALATSAVNAVATIPLLTSSESLRLTTARRGPSQRPSPPPQRKGSWSALGYGPPPPLRRGFKRPPSKASFSHASSEATGSPSLPSLRTPFIPPPHTHPRAPSSRRCPTSSSQTMYYAPSSYAAPAEVPLDAACPRQWGCS
jgi:hypothetical protein